MKKNHLRLVTPAMMAEDRASNDPQNFQGNGLAKETPWQSLVGGVIIVLIVPAFLFLFYLPRRVEPEYQLFYGWIFCAGTAGVLIFHALKKNKAVRAWFDWNILGKDDGKEEK